MHIGVQIGNRREEIGMRQVTLQKLLEEKGVKVAIATIWRWERGTAVPNYDDHSVIEDVLKFKINYQNNDSESGVESE